MRYVPPFGISDPDAPYINGDPTIGRQGSIPPAAAFEHPMREIVNVISYSGVTPTDTPLPAALRQMAVAIRSQAMNFASDTGSVNNLSVALDPPLQNYTQGLPLHVRVNHDSTAGCRLNAGAGWAPIRKMDGSDVGEGDLHAGGIASVVYDNGVWQLTNFLGRGIAGAAGDQIFYTIKIPYTVDSSATPGTITANFNPPITELGAGDVIAVKVKNTNPGPTVIFVDNLSENPITLRPNGGNGDHTLAGDIHANDIVILFYDGTDFWFTPNPEIDERIEYSVGPGRQFATIAEAMEKLRRKAIGATGFVTLKMVQGEFQGPIVVSHPSGDRIKVCGTMTGPNPTWQTFARNHWNQPNRNADAVVNLARLKSSFGTEILVGHYNGTGEFTQLGLRNEGPGTVRFADLLVRSEPAVAYANYNNGIRMEHSKSAQFNNVSVWGCTSGLSCETGASVVLVDCFMVNCTSYGWHIGYGGNVVSYRCGCYGSTYGMMVAGANANNYEFYALACDYGVYVETSTVRLAWATITVNYWDVYAITASSITVWEPSYMPQMAPAFWIVGNYGSVITTTNVPQSNMPTAPT